MVPFYGRGLKTGGLKRQKSKPFLAFTSLKFIQCIKFWWSRFWNQVTFCRIAYITWRFRIIGVRAFGNNLPEQCFSGTDLLFPSHRLDFPTAQFESYASSTFISCNSSHGVDFYRKGCPVFDLRTSSTFELWMVYFESYETVHFELSPKIGLEWKKTDKIDHLIWPWCRHPGV